MGSEKQGGHKRTVILTLVESGKLPDERVRFPSLKARSGGLYLAEQVRDAKVVEDVRKEVLRNRGEGCEASS